LSDWLTETLALERVGNSGQAAVAYETAIGHWPDAPAPHMALANIHMARQDFKQARIALEDALPKSGGNMRGAVLNNLAHVLMKLENWPAAEQMAQRAVEAGGQFEATARQTLAEIRAARRARQSQS
jgi:Tfp pilus assembly protein PilF